MGNIKSHDHLFKKAMSRIKVAREFFEDALPDHILQKLDLSTLKTLPTNFVDSTLSEGTVDLLYSVNFSGSKGYLWIICEHQSTPDRLITLRMKKYMLRICSDHIKKHPNDKLPLIYPILVYTGKTKYNAPLIFWELFEKPELAKKFFTEAVQLIDVSKLSDKELKRHAYSRLMLHFLAKIHEKEILPYIKMYAEIIRSISEKDFTYVEDLLIYILEKGRSKQMTEVISTFQETVAESEKGKVMTIADQLREEGRKEAMTMAEKLKEESKIAGMEAGIQKGIEKGRQEGIKKVAINMLLKGLDEKIIVESTGLSIEEIERLES